MSVDDWEDGWGGVGRGERGRKAGEGGVENVARWN